MDLNAGETGKPYTWAAADGATMMKFVEAALRKGMTIQGLGSDRLPKDRAGNEDRDELRELHVISRLSEAPCVVRLIDGEWSVSDSGGLSSRVWRIIDVAGLLFPQRTKETK